MSLDKGGCLFILWGLGWSQTISYLPSILGIWNQSYLVYSPAQLWRSTFQHHILRCRGLVWLYSLSILSLENIFSHQTLLKLASAEADLPIWHRMYVSLPKSDVIQLPRKQNFLLAFTLLSSIEIVFWDGWKSHRLWFQGS